MHKYFALFCIVGTYRTANTQVRIQGVGTRAGTHPWDGETPFKIHHSIAFKHRSIWSVAGT